MIVHGTQINTIYQNSKIVKFFVRTFLQQHSSIHWNLEKKLLVPLLVLQRFAKSIHS
jgi:hypothetical protein